MPVAASGRGHAASVIDVEDTRRAMALIGTTCGRRGTRKGQPSPAPSRATATIADGSEPLDEFRATEPHAAGARDPRGPIDEATMPPRRRRSTSCGATTDPPLPLNVGGHRNLPAGGHQVGTVAVTEGERSLGSYRPENRDQIADYVAQPCCGSALEMSVVMGAHCVVSDRLGQFGQWRPATPGSGLIIIGRDDCSPTSSPRLPGPTEVVAAVVRHVDKELPERLATYLNRSASLVSLATYAGQS